MYSCTLKGSMTFSSFCARYFEKGEISKTPHLKKNVSKTVYPESVIQLE